jgi:Domain of unknown function (DUF4272)
MSLPRTAQEAAVRLLALAAVSGVAQGVDRSDVVAWLRQEGVWNHLSPCETEFLESASPAERDVIAFSWRMECVYVIGWALMLQDDLSAPSEQASIATILDHVPGPGEPVGEFIQLARLRELDLIQLAAIDYRDMHARARNPKGTAVHDIEVIQERHYALNWLLNTEGQEWDLVTTDT